LPGATALALVQSGQSLRATFSGAYAGNPVGLREIECSGRQ
jgi:hypothetical protein